MIEKTRIGVIGLGYVGLPIALAFAEKYEVVGFDISQEKVAQLNKSIDPSDEIDTKEFKGKNISFSATVEALASCNVYIVAVPTPVDKHKVPNLVPLKKATESVGSILKKGDTVIYESTVYPGCTEEVCVPILEQTSDLKYITDFKVGYSPERINPGDKKHTLSQIVKVVSGCDQESLDKIGALYGSIIEAGIHSASSIKVAEAAKIIENTQRDVNIALMNELAIIFDKLDISTHEVLEAAGTKWNFLKFYPGLVGGHCIGVDPYYLTYKAQQVGYDPEVILSGRRINDNTPQFISKKIIRNLLKQNKKLSECSALVKGITFKENVSDIRNSKVIDLINELKEFSIEVDVMDSRAKEEDVKREYSLELISVPEKKYEVLIIAVAHDEYVHESFDNWKDFLADNPIIFDVRSLYKDQNLSESSIYLSL